MQRKQGGLVPVAETLADLHGPVTATRDASPQARHHFTRFDQIHQLVSASEADSNLGFMVRTMALCSLPRTNPGNSHQYKRVNGPYKLVMVAGADNQAPLRHHPSPLAGLALHRTGTDSKPRTRPGAFALEVHADVGDRQRQRWDQGRTDTFPQPDETAFWLHRLTDLRRRTR